MKKFKIIEPEKMICGECKKELKSAKEGIGIPAFKGSYFIREWVCCKCFNKKFMEVLNENKNI